jgi:predicted RNase H-like HicB family nuclease
MMQYPIVIYPYEEGGYVVKIPALKGCLAQGETLDEVLCVLRTVADLCKFGSRRIHVLKQKICRGEFMLLISDVTITFVRTRPTHN